MIQTVLCSLLSVLLRSSNSVFDRWSYGLRRQSILALNFANNCAPFLMLAAMAALRGGLEEVRRSALDPRLVLFALSIQGVGFAFSYGFQRLPIAKLNVAARMGDVLIPLSLMLCGRSVTAGEYLFALAVSVCSMVAIRGEGDLQRRSVLVPGLLITSSVILQSVCGELFFRGRDPAAMANLEVTTAVMFWRSALCLALVAVASRLRSGGQLQWARDRRAWLSLGLRSALTVGAQLAFTLALSFDHRVIAWPILNSVTLFSVVLAGAFIKEYPERRELLAVTAVVVLSLARVML